MNFPESVRYLYSLGHETLAMKLGLKNIEELLAALNSPQNSYFKIQIAGTNGKGSTAAFLEAICRAAGIKTGLFTSPHLISITERIKINGIEISENLFAETVGELKNIAEKLVFEKRLEVLPTFFEHLTAIGLLALAREKIELAILETGLGGRLDSTTAAESQIAVITPVSFDHQEYLGNSLPEIAAEKAAIIHAQTRAAIVSHQESAVLKIIADRCDEFEIKPVKSAQVVDKIYIPEIEKFRVSFKTASESYKDVLLGLRGRHQFENAATALSAAETLRDFGFKITREAVIKGLETAVHPGRLEFVELPPHRFLFDGAHNAAGAAALRDFLEEFNFKPLTLVFGAMRDKDLAEIASALFPAVSNLILTRVENPRSAEPVDLQKLVLKKFGVKNTYLAENLEAALNLAREITLPENLICVTGSLYLVGAALKYLKENR